MARPVPSPKRGRTFRLSNIQGRGSQRSHISQFRGEPKWRLGSEGGRASARRLATYYLPADIAVSVDSAKVGGQPAVLAEPIQEYSLGRDAAAQGRHRHGFRSRPVWSLKPFR